MLPAGALAQVMPSQPGKAPLDKPPSPTGRVAKFGVIGDYGFAGPAENAVSKQVKNMDLDFIITTGDNNYDLGDVSTIDANIGQYYQDFISPYSGAYGSGALTNRFFPSLGNHDWYTAQAQAYLNFFTLPGNERYYDFVRGPVHFFSIDSDPNEPDGFLATSVQGQWLQSALAAATEPWKIVYFHHGPYSSADHGTNFWMDWPFKQWGASLVLNGHDHTYERLVENGIPYIVNGLGGRSLYNIKDPIYGSLMRFNSDFGFMTVEAVENAMTLRFFTRSANLIDEYTIHPDFKHYAETSIVPRGASWKYLDNGTNAGTAWRALAFNDAGWKTGNAQLGYGDGDETTVVNSGPSGNKFITTYFRHVFNVANPAQFTNLGLQLLRDDGAVVYLNGTEVYRTNMPSGAISFTTLASSATADLHEFSYYGTFLPASLLVPGNNILAIEIHQDSPTSSDISMECQLLGLNGDTTIFGKGSVWQYWDKGSVPAGAWTEPQYDASAWSAGPAKLGYGDGDEATVVSFGPDSNYKYITTYFRKTFMIADKSAIHNLVARIRRDDGIIVYINGHEVNRSNMMAGPSIPDALAPLSVSGAEETRFTETWLDKRWLVDGRNVIAVEIHQNSPTSSDLGFDMELVAF